MVVIAAKANQFQEKVKTIDSQIHKSELTNHAFQNHLDLLVGMLDVIYKLI